MRASILCHASALTVLFLFACATPSSEGGETGDSDSGTEEGGSGPCLMTDALEHRVSFTSAESLSDGTHDCELVSAAAVDGTLTIELDCPTAQPGPTTITILAPADATLPSLQPGAQLSFRLIDGVEEGDPELEFELRDDQGPIVAMSQFAPAYAEFLPMLMRFESYCDLDPPPEDANENNGFVQVEAGDQTLDVFPGTPQNMTVDGVEWEIHALVAERYCCEGASISVELIRRN